MALVDDELDDAERAELEAAIEESEAELDAGQVVTEEELWAQLRALARAPDARDAPRHASLRTCVKRPLRRRKGPSSQR